ncbi:helix-turn-helix domain-containing protein [Corallibacter sp.]|uniref:helix-turn-helix domain-containing protein n=1 Tax=Corallibacter sp. TaxID=2038084 RepID=UPI003A94AD60
MTRLGVFLEKKSIKKADVSRKTGISQSRMSELTNNHSTRLSVDELYLISLAIDTDPSVIMKEICSHLKLVDETKVENNISA